MLIDLDTVLPIEVISKNSSFDEAVYRATDSAIRQFGKLPDGTYSRVQLFEKVAAVHVDFVRYECRVSASVNAHVYHFSAYTRKG